MFIVPKPKKLKIISRIQVCSIRHKKFDSIENDKKKLFLPNQCTNIMYPNENNVFIVPNHKRQEIIMRIHICPI